MGTEGGLSGTVFGRRSAIPFCGGFRRVSFRGIRRATLWLHLLVAMGGGAETSWAVAVQYATRTDRIQAEREAKRVSARPEQISSTEARLNFIQDNKLLERLAFGYHGLTMVLGGLENGQGFALGPQYQRTDFADGDVNVRASARYGFARAYFGDAAVSLPRLASDRAFLEFSSVYRNYPEMDYFGPGASSSLDDEAQFRLEDTLLHARFGVRPLPHVNFGIEGGALFVNTGSGVVSSGEPTIAQQFDPSSVPGVIEQTDFLSSGVFLQYDYRDNPLGARSGGNYVARFRYFNDRELERHDFRRLDLEAQQFLPFFNKRRVLALRVQTALTFTNGTSRVPFYLQPVLGGSDNLRGFVPFRFYDDNLIVANVEYRWESFSGLDMAVFFDAGKVASRPADIDLTDLETSVGLGFRFNVRNATFIRIDTGFSHEGAQIWLKFADAF